MVARPNAKPVPTFAGRHSGASPRRRALLALFNAGSALTLPVLTDLNSHEENTHDTL